MQKDAKPCMIFSLEMPQKQILKRMVHTVSGVNPRAIRRKQVTEDELENVQLCMQDIKGLPMYTSHRVRDVEDLVVQCRTMHRKYGIELVLIDYLQLIPWDARKFDKVQAISDISHKIKQMAIELNLPVLLLSQVNRDGARSEALQLYHLRDSGDIENDADVIILMHPDGMTMDKATRINIDGEYKKMIYNIAKNREGERDIKGEFKFFNQLGRFY
jgi:replicative DNA helicase